MYMANKWLEFNQLRRATKVQILRTAEHVAVVSAS